MVQNVRFRRKRNKAYILTYDEKQYLPAVPTRRPDCTDLFMRHLSYFLDRAECDYECIPLHRKSKCSHIKAMKLTRLLDDLILGHFLSYLFNVP